MQVVWRDKLIAFGIHFCVTLLLAAAAAALVFLVWFPPPFARMIGGNELFLLVVGCDLGLGPLMSLVIFNRGKSRRALITDYTFVGVVQIAALVYGLIIMSGTRPVYVAFVKDRLEVVSARDISDAELAAARDTVYGSLPWTGPEFVAVIIPPKEQQDVMFAALGGLEEHVRPRYYRPFAEALPEIQSRAGTIADLRQKHSSAVALIDAKIAASGVPAERLRSLPVRHRLGFWTALVDSETGMPVAYVPVDPYEKD